MSFFFPLGLMATQGLGNKDFTRQYYVGGRLRCFPPPPSHSHLFCSYFSRSVNGIQRSKHGSPAPLLIPPLVSTESICPCCLATYSGAVQETGVPQKVASSSRLKGAQLSDVLMSVVSPSNSISARHSPDYPVRFPTFQTLPRGEGERNRETPQQWETAKISTSISCMCLSI